MINYSIEALMSRLGCEKYPQRWNDIYAEALEIYNKGENPLLRQEFYDTLHEKYGVFDCFN